MKKTGFIFLFCIIFCSLNSLAQDDCKVKVPELKGKYEGDCKKGLAHGKGHAIGSDEYKGRFKKGYPHGKGIYTWKNGNVFEGKFKKGKKHGAGKLTIRKADGDSIVEGTWKDDVFDVRSLYKNAYKELYKRSIARTSCLRRVDGNQIDIVFQSGGHRPKDVLLSGDSGRAIDDISYIGFKDVKFPFKGSVRYRIMNKAQTSELDCELKFSINQPGHYELKLYTN